jgi:hypothetical protein
LPQHSVHTITRFATGPPEHFLNAQSRNAHRVTRRRRSAWPTTETELNVASGVRADDASAPAAIDAACPASPRDGC